MLLLLLPLAACASPQQRCIDTATKEIRLLDRLITRTESNLLRGYRVQTEQRLTPRLQFCASPSENFVLCSGPTLTSVKTSVAIDPVVERRKLASLKARRRALASRAQQQIAACRARYPAR